MTGANKKKANKTNKKSIKNEESTLKKKGTKNTVKINTSSSEFLTVEEMCNKFDGKRVY